MTESEFKRALELCAKATPGPWHEVDDERVQVDGGNHPVAEVFNPFHGEGYDQERSMKHNTAFIAHFHPDRVKKLLLDYEIMREVVGRVVAQTQHTPGLPDGTIALARRVWKEIEG